MDVNFELYKIFYHAARAGSFSNAAKHLYISQSAVSQAIGNLEEKIGCRLFTRKSRSMKLTTEGEMLYKHIEQAYNFIKIAEGKLLEMQSLSLGEVRIGVGDTICKYYLVNYLKLFISKYPNIKVKVINRTTPQIIDILKNGQIDLGIVTLPVSDNDINVFEFKEVNDVFVSSPRYSELDGKSIPVSQLIKYPLLLLQKDSTTRRNLDEFFAKNGLEIAPEIELESVELLVEFARIGLGIAHVLKESASQFIENKELFIVKTSEELPARKLGIAIVKNVPLSEASSRFIEILNT